MLVFFVLFLHEHHEKLQHIDHHDSLKSNVFKVMHVNFKRMYSITSKLPIKIYAMML